MVIFGKSFSNTTSTLPGDLKKRISKVTTATSGPSENFSVDSYDMKFVFASLLMIISISQSKRGGLTTLRSD